MMEICLGHFSMVKGHVGLEQAHLLQPGLEISPCSAGRGYTVHVRHAPYAICRESRVNDRLRVKGKNMISGIQAYVCIYCYVL